MRDQRRRSVEQILQRTSSCAITKDGSGMPSVREVDRSHAGYMERGVKHHQGMAVGEHKAIAIGPKRIGWIEAQEALPEGINNGHQRHPRTGVSRVGFLHRVHRKGANGIDERSSIVGDEAARVGFDAVFDGAIGLNRVAFYSFF
jgi:hypothetical protein